MYVFELFYRPKISPVSVGHHIGTIMIGQSAIAISLNLIRESDATIEFILCTVWVRSPPHWRIHEGFERTQKPYAYFLLQAPSTLYRNSSSCIDYLVSSLPTSHKFLRKIFRLACITTLTGTTAETVLTMYLFGSLWDRWTMAFKVTTPMLHCLFAAAQLWGSYNFYKMYQKQDRIIAEMETEWMRRQDPK